MASWAQTYLWRTSSARLHHPWGERERTDRALAIQHRSLWISTSRAHLDLKNRLRAEPSSEVMSREAPTETVADALAGENPGAKVEAFDTLRRALRRDPENEIIYYRLALVRLDAEALAEPTPSIESPEVEIPGFDRHFESRMLPRWPTSTSSVATATTRPGPCARGSSCDSWTSRSLTRWCGST